MQKDYGISFIELLVVASLIAVITLPMVDILSSTFLIECENRQNVKAKEFRELALNRMSSTLKNASFIADDTHPAIVIPVGDSTYQFTPGYDGIVALVPKYKQCTGGFSSDCYDVERDGAQTEFKAYAYSLVPNYLFDNNSSATYAEMVLVESYTEFSCTPLASNPVEVSAACELDWSNLPDTKTNIIFNKALPGSFSETTKTFDIVQTNNYHEANLVNISFGVQGGTLYYPAGYGEKINNENTHAVSVLALNVPTY